MKPIAKHFWILSLVLSLLLGGTLASAHGYDHLEHEGHSDHVGQHLSESWLDELVHADDDEDNECGLLLLGSISTLASLALLLDTDTPSTGPLAGVVSVHCFPVVRLRPPSRAPPSFS